MGGGESVDLLRARGATDAELEAQGIRRLEVEPGRRVGDVGEPGVPPERALALYDAEFALRQLGVDPSDVDALSPYRVHTDPITKHGPMGIDMSEMTPIEITGHGEVRNRFEFWDAWAARYPETLSDHNRTRIGRRSPVVDYTWVQHFPQHLPFLGQVLHHHHLNYGPIAIPLPESLHLWLPWTRHWHP